MDKPQKQQLIDELLNYFIKERKKQKEQMIKEGKFDYNPELLNKTPEELFIKYNSNNLNQK